MGCDIHFFTEVKIDGVWHTASSPTVWRSYMLFAKMAGVRNTFDITPVSQPKGLPDDTSAVFNAYYEYWKEDAHSASWLNAEEVAEVEAFDEAYRKSRYEPSLGYLFRSSLSHFHLYPDDILEAIEDFRAVFFFDN